MKFSIDKKEIFAGLFTGLFIIGVGIIFITGFWDSLSTWWHIINMPFDEVKDTPYVAIWNSGRGLMGVFAVFCGLSTIVLSLKKAIKIKGQSKEPNVKL